MDENNEVVRVYRNLTKGCYSIQSKTPRSGWKVKGHCDYICLAKVHFRVYEKARQRVLRTHEKNVHSFAIGIPSTSSSISLPTGLTRISYNPYVTGEFRDSSGNSVKTAKLVFLTPFGVYINV